MLEPMVYDQVLVEKVNFSFERERWDVKVSWALAGSYAATLKLPAGRGALAPLLEAAVRKHRDLTADDVVFIINDEDLPPVTPMRKKRRVCM